MQGPASDYLLMAIITMFNEFNKLNMPVTFVSTVHDSVVLEVPDAYVEEATKLGVYYIENVPKYKDIYFPNVDFSWLRLTMKADADVSDYYGTKVIL